VGLALGGEAIDDVGDRWPIEAAAGEELLETRFEGAFVEAVELAGAFVRDAVGVFKRARLDARRRILGHRRLDAVLPQLSPQQPFTTRPERAALVNPVLRESRVVDEAVLLELRDRRIDRRLVEAGAPQPLPNLVFAARPVAEIAQGDVDGLALRRAQRDPPPPG
jgi:hypothetical protein